MNLDIFADILTKQNLLEFKDQLKSALKDIEIGQIDPKKAIMNNVDEPRNIIVVEMVEKNGVESLEELIRTIDNFDIAKLTLSFNPKKEQLEKMVNLLRGNLNEMLFVELEIDQSIIGGLIYYFKGRYKDYSVKTMIENM